MAKLKPCPFCGGEAETIFTGVLVSTQEKLERVDYHTRCAACLATSFKGTSREQSRAKWNERAENKINWQPMHTMPEDRHVSLKTKTGAIIKGKSFASRYRNESGHFYIEHSDLFNPEYIDRICLSVNFVGWTELLEDQ